MSATIVSKPVPAEASGYDDLAWFYDRHWSGHYHPWAIEVLGKTVLDRVAPGGSILDVCCGNGVLARELCARGYSVTGIDASAEMLACARRNAPGARFLSSDARLFSLPAEFDAAISTFDSLNHVLTAADLGRVFRNVRRALRPNAPFVFDLNLEGAYRTAWNESCVSVDGEHACFIRGRYEARLREATTQITLFRGGASWRRFDIELRQRYYPPDVILRLLQTAGFTGAAMFDAAADLGVAGPFSNGRGVFRAFAP